MKRTLISLLCLTTLLTAFIVPFSVSATETWDDVGDYWEGGIYHEFGAVTGMYQKMQGNYTNAVAPGNTKTFSQVYSGLSKGYVYTIKQSYNVSVQPGGLTDTIINNTNPCFVTVDSETYTKASLGELFPVDTYRKSGDYADSASIDATDLFRLSGYISWRHQRATVTFVIEPLDDYYFLTHYWGLGCNFNDGLQSLISAVTLSGMDIKATKAVTSDTYYQEQLAAMESLQTEVQQQGQATVNAIDQNGEQTRQTIDEAKTEITDSIKNQPQNEHSYIEENKGNENDVSLPEVDISGIQSFAENLVSVLSTTETVSGIAIPAMKMPGFVGGQELYPATTFDLSFWLNDDKIGSLIDFGKGVISIACLYGIVKQAYNLIQFALGTKGDDDE